MLRSRARFRGLCLTGCGEPIKKGATRFCSLSCQQRHQYCCFIERWKAGEVDGTITSFDLPSHHIRRYLFEKYGSQCSICGWNEVNERTGRVPLHVDHIDGNARNNHEDNLRLLCPNHHSLTPTYGKCNVGNGRAGRRARYLRSYQYKN